MNTQQTALAIVATLLLGCSSSSIGQDAATDRSPADTSEAGVDATPCDAPRVTCGATCTSLQWSHLHCGACDRRCQGHEVCIRGQCVRGNVCPSNCMNHDDCRTCTYATDPTVFCCVQTPAGTGRCSTASRCERSMN